MKTRVIAGIVALMLMAIPAGTALAAGSNICASTCSRAEVGPFMYGISQACGNEGTCSLDDIQIVFNNVANYVLEIVAALVFLMYVIGGFFFLVSGLPGQEKLREKGKTALKTSTIGLIIVFGAYAFMHTLFGVLQGSDLGDGVDFATCGPGSVNKDEPCARNSKCTVDGLCLSLCERESTTTKTVTATGTTTTWQACFDSEDGMTSNGVEAISDVDGKCPGPDTEKCTTFTYTSQ